MTSEISCAIPSNGVDWSGGNVASARKFCRKARSKRQRIFAADLQVEDVELVTGGKLQRGEDRLVPALRPERLLDQSHKALGTLADVGLADQRQFRALGPEHRR